MVLNIPVDQRLDLVRSWVSECHSGSEKHVPCKHYCETARQKLNRPKSLLQLRKEDDKLLFHIRCTESGLVDDTYATVSYEWTDNPSFTDVDIDAFSSWGSIDRLPRCLQDAAEIVLAAGVQNLWAPLLCSGEDDKPERQGDLYAGGLFNIAALNTNKSTEGCLPSPRTRDRVPVIAPGWAPHQLFVVNDAEKFKESVTKSHLWQRASFQQEILLSPATIYCTKDELWWQCFEGAIHSEGFATGVGLGSQPDVDMEGAYDLDPKLFANFDPHFAYGWSSATSFGGRYDSFAECLTAFWISVITAYSRTKAESSVLKVAILNSMAAHVRDLAIVRNPSFASVSYTNGVWSDMLIEQLAWFADEENTEASLRRTVDKQLPTWSWLAVDGPVSYEFLDSEMLGAYTNQMYPRKTQIRPVAAARILQGPTSYAPGRALQIHGRLFEAAVKAESGQYTSELTSEIRVNGIVPVLVVWDCLEEMESARGNDSEEQYAAMPIFVHSSEPNQVYEVRGLLLRQLETHANTFVRCGWFMPHEDAAIPSHLADLIQGASIRTRDFILV